MKIKWKGKGINEKAYDHNNKVIIECNKKYFRPSEVDTLLGNPSKAKKQLKWKPKVSIKELANEMVEEDLKLLSQNDKKNDKIFVAGHNGLVGSAVLRKLRENNFKKNYFRGKKKN